MIKVDCAVVDVDNEPGDCLRACLASVLELPLASVPHVVRDGEAWFSSLQTFLALYGLRCLCLPMGLPIYNEAVWDMIGPAIVICGVFVDGDISRPHAVVAQSGKVLHDPIPYPFKKTEILDNAFDVLVFVALDPCKEQFKVPNHNL